MSIKKIAEIVGVSPSTVSRVLNNPDYKCSAPGIREAIWNTAIELNYTPNEAARNLKLGVKPADEQIFGINVLVTRTESSQTDPFLNEMLSVVESEIYKNKCVLSHVMYMSILSDDVKCAETDLNSLIDNAYNEIDGDRDGLVVIGKCNVDALKIWQTKYKSIVSVNRNSTNYEVDEVICDGRKIAKTAVNYLIELGHRHIGYVGSCHNEARYRGFQDALREHNLDIEPGLIIETTPGKNEGYQAMSKYMKMNKPPTGIYCANDIIAVGMFDCMKKYRKMQYRPSVVASDDIKQAQMTDPMLSTVRLPSDEMGKFAVWLLVDRMKKNHRSIARIELEGQLIKRMSCEPLNGRNGENS